MKYPNAYAGIKKVFASQILHILSTLFSFASSMILVFDKEAASWEDFNPFFWASMGLMTAGVVLSVVAFILQLVGLNRARRDERLFKKAMYFVIICAVCTVSLLFGSGMFGKIMAGIDEVSTLLIFVYIFIAVFNLADQLGDMGMQKKGKLALLLVTVMFGVAFVLQIVMAFIPDLVEVVENLAVLGTILEFIGYIVALLYIGAAKKMLAKA